MSRSVEGTKPKKGKKKNPKASTSSEENDSGRVETIEEDTTMVDAGGTQDDSTISDKDANNTDPKPSPALASKKRKRDASPPSLTIDLSLPEPPSKKALRKLKKAAPAALPKPVPTPGPHASQSRSQHGIWVGNLSFFTTEADLKTFLTASSSPITLESISRINLPLSGNGKNKGFAYIDFTSLSALTYALTLSEKELNGRKLLIKNSKDFSNRGGGEEKKHVGANPSKNPPSRILFVGNLAFDVTAEMLQEHFAFAGKIAKLRLATFEDTGRCKGFGFVDFEDVDSVRRAMMGVSKEEEEVMGTIEGKAEEDLTKRIKKRKVLGGRMMKMEYGEDPGVRYKKRFGKKEGEEGAEVPDIEEVKEGKEKVRESGDEGSHGKESSDKKNFSSEKRGKDAHIGKEKKLYKKVNIRSSNPGAPYTNDVRRIGAITASTGKKTKFDE